MNGGTLPNSRVDLTSGVIPPGQSRTDRFPVVGERAPSRTPPTGESSPPSGWTVAIAGRVEQPVVLTDADRAELPRSDLVADIHCVTGWTHLAMGWTGTPLATVLALARPRPDARFVRFIAHSERAHDTSLPLDVATSDGWLVDRYAGQPIPTEHGGPVRIVVPSRYFYKSLKWVARIELLTDDRLGYWERESSYHNIGDPLTGDQRFTTGSLRPEQVARFLTAQDYAKYRGRAMVGLDLRSWSPAAHDLSLLQLKGCDLRGVDLSHRDLHGINLSLSDLRRADLSGSDLTDADLEGADLREANLTGAVAPRTALSATKLVGAHVTGLDWQGASGLLEADEAWLRDHTN